MAGATITTLDNVLSDCYLPPFRDELDREGIRHTCGRPYDVRFLDTDGAILRRNPSTDTFEATLLAECPDCARRGAGDALVYGRMALSGHAMSRTAGGLLSLVTMELKHLLHSMKNEMLGIAPPPRMFPLEPEVLAEIAEGVTRALRVKGSMLLSEVREAFNIAEHQEERLQGYLGWLGFIRDRNWRVPVPPERQNLFAALSADMAVLGPAAPSFEYRVDPLLALPVDHPLAA